MNHIKKLGLIALLLLMFVISMSGVTAEINWSTDVDFMIYPLNSEAGTITSGGTYPAYDSLEDLSGNSNNATAYNEVTITNNTSFNFDGIDNKLTTGYDPNFGTSAFSISFWIKKTTNGTEIIMGQWTSAGSSTKAWYFGKNVDGTISFNVYTGSGYNNKLITGVLNSGSWYHVVAVRNTTSHIYVNAVSVTNDTFTTVDLVSLPADVVIGFFDAPDTTSPTWFLESDLTSPAIFNKALTSTEISDLYAEGRTYNPYAEPTPPGDVTIESARIDPIDPTYEQDLLGYCNGTTLNNESIKYNYEWYKNGELNLEGRTEYANFITNYNRTKLPNYSYVYNDYVFTSSSSSEIAVYSFDGLKLTLLDNLTPASGLLGKIVFDGNYLYSSRYGSSLDIYSFNGTDLEYIRTKSGRTIEDMYKEDDILFAAASDTIIAYNATGSDLVEKTTLYTGYSNLGIWKNDEYIYVAAGADGIRSFTYDGTSFTSSGTIDDGGLAKSIVADDKYIYLANKNDGLRIYTHNGTSFTNVAHYDTVEDAVRITIDDNYIYVATESGLTMIFSFNGTNITLYDTIGSTSSSDIKLNDDYIFNLDSIKGVMVYSKISLPVSYCYQETANISTECGGLDTGSYYFEDEGSWQNTEYFYDGDWVTSARSPLTGDVYINYTIPAETLSAEWSYSIGYQFETDGIFSCYDGSSWISYSRGGYEAPIMLDTNCLYGETLQLKINLPSFWYIQEEAITWGIKGLNSSIETNVANISSELTSIGENWTLSCQASNGTINSTWLNSTSVTITSLEPQLHEVNLTPLEPVDTEPVQGQCNATDPEGDDINYYYKWYVNNIETLTGNITKPNGTTNLTMSEFAETNYNLNDNVTFACAIKDADHILSAYTNTTILIKSYPNINISTPVHNTVYGTMPNLVIRIQDSYNGTMSFNATPSEYQSNVIPYSIDVEQSFSSEMVAEEGFNTYNVEAITTSGYQSSETINFWRDSDAPEVIYSETTTVNPESDWINVEVEITEPCLYNTTFELSYYQGALIDTHTIIETRCDPTHPALNESVLRSNNFTGLIQGLYTINATVTSKTGKITSLGNIHFGIDQSGPTVEILSPILDWYWYAVDPNILAKVHTTNTLDTCYYIANGIRTDIACSNNTEFLISGVSWAEGMNTVTIIANDTLGNIGIQSRYFYLDTETPSISFISPTPDNDEIISSTQFTVAVESSTNNIDYIRTAVYNSSGNLYDSYLDYSRPYVNTFTVNKNDNYSIKSKIINKAGVSSYTELRNITITGNPPSLNLLTPTDNGRYNTNVNITYEVSDFESNEFYYSKNPSITTADNKRDLSQAGTLIANYIIPTSLDVSALEQCYIKVALCKNGEADKNLVISIAPNADVEINTSKITTVCDEDNSFDWIYQSMSCQQLSTAPNPTIKLTCLDCDGTDNYAIMGNSYSSGSSSIINYTGGYQDDETFDYMIEIIGSDLTCGYNYNGNANQTISCLESVTDINWTEGTNTLNIFAKNKLNITATESVSFIKDTVNPLMTIRYPEMDNSSEYYGTINVDFDMTFIDNNLFGFQIECYDNIGLTGDTEYYHEVTNISITTYPFIGSGEFKDTGRKYCKVTVSDDHTINNFSADVNIKEKLFMWEFNGIEFDKGNVEIFIKSKGTEELFEEFEYIERSDRISPVIKLKEQTDDFWKYYFKTDNYIDEDITLSFNIKTPGHKIHYREDVSGILGHIVITPKDSSHAHGYWYDLESNVDFKSLDTNMITDEEIEYKITVPFRELQDKDFTIETNSLGGLNFAEEYFNFIIYTGNEVTYEGVDVTTDTDADFKMTVTTPTTTQIYSGNYTYDLALDCVETTITVSSSEYKNSYSFNGDGCDFSDRTFDFWESELTIRTYNIVSGDLIPSSNIILNMTNYNVDDNLSIGEETYYTRGEAYTINASADNFLPNTVSDSIAQLESKTQNIGLTPTYSINIYREETQEPFSFIQNIGDPYECGDTTELTNVTTQKYPANVIEEGSFTEAHPAIDAYDELWETYSLPDQIGTANLSILFLKEGNSYNTSYLKIKTSQSMNSTFVMSDYQDCWDNSGNSVQFYTESNNIRTYLYCENSTDKQWMATFENGGAVYETKMYFNNEINESVEKDCWDTKDISIEMIVACDNKEITRTITTQTFDISNITCDYNYIDFDIIYESSGMLQKRRYVPDKNTHVFDVYMIDQNYESPVELGIHVYDISGIYKPGRIRVYRLTNDSRILVTDNTLDQSNDVILYLQENTEYELCAVDQDEQETCDYGTKFVQITEKIEMTLPQIPYGGEITNKIVSTVYVKYTTEGAIEMNYTDRASATQSIDWDIFDGEKNYITSSHFDAIGNDSINATGNSSKITMWVFGLDNTKDYLSVVTASRVNEPVYIESRILIFDFSNVTFTGFEGDQVCYTSTKTFLGEQKTTITCKDKTSEMVKTFIAIIIPILILLVGSLYSGTVSMLLSTVILGFFKGLGWLWYFNTIMPNATIYFWGLFGLMSVIIYYMFANEMKKKV